MAEDSENPPIVKKAPAWMYDIAATYIMCTSDSDSDMWFAETGAVMHMNSRKVATHAK